MEHISDTINIGVADIYFYPKGQDTPIYLGLTTGGCTFKYELEWHEINADQTGTTPLDDVLIGEKGTFEASLLDTSKEKIGLIVPSAEIEGDKDSPSAVTFGRRPGLRATHNSGRLRIHPISMGNDNSYDIHIYRTINTGNMELAFKNDTEWIIPCVFKAYYDDFRKPGDQLFRIGDYSSGSDVPYRRVIQFWITPSNPEAKIGETIDFSAKAMYEDGTTEDVTTECRWASSSTDKATIALSVDVARAAALRAGSVVIRAEYIGYSNTTSLIIRDDTIV